EAEGQGFRQGLRRSRGGVSPGRPRRDRQSAHPEREERGAQGTDREGPSRDRGSPRAREADPVEARVVRLVAIGLVAAAGWLSAPAARAATQKVVIEGMKFAPPELVIHPGDTVVWTN